VRDRPWAESADKMLIAPQKARRAPGIVSEVGERM
jgi:hypothetical protein